MKYHYQIIVLFLVLLYGCSQQQKKQPLNLISERQWQEVLGLKESGQTKAAEDSLLQMIIRNARNERWVGDLGYFLSNMDGFAGRRPYWEVKKLSTDSLNYMKAALSETLGYLQHLQLVSPTTSQKLEKSIKSGVVYSPMEVFYLADALGRSETLLKSANCARDLQTLTEQGIFSAADLPVITKDIQKGTINQVSEIIDNYGHNVIHIECPQKIADEQTYLRDLIGQILSQLPFHQSHSIESIQFVKMEEWAGRGLDPYTLIHLVFNGRPYFISYGTSTLGYQLSKHVHIEFLPELLHTLARDFGQSLEVHVVPAYYLNYVTAINSNITGYHIFLSRTATTSLSGNTFYNNEVGSQDSLFAADKKEEYQNNVLSVLDRHWVKPLYDSIQFRLKWLNIPPNSQMSLQFPKVTHTVWVDDLNDEDPSPFKPIFDCLNNISGDRLKGFTIKGNCANIEEGESYQLRITFNHHQYATILKKGVYIDYGFINLIKQLQETEELGGRFYYLPLDNFEDGYTFIFLTTEEFNRLQQHPYFAVVSLENLEKML